MAFSSIFILFLSLQFLQFSHSATVVVDGVSQWKNPKLQIGDSVIFQHKYHYNLYIFKNQEAFSDCNFTQATILTKPTSASYTWHTSRPGFFYFAFNYGSSQPCLQGQKLAVEVFSAAAAEVAPPQAASPEIQPPVEAAPPPFAGGIVASSPAFPWPFKPKESPSPSPSPESAAEAPEKEGIPFINSNPAVPLPTGEVDSATIRPLPTSGGGDRHYKQVVGFSAVERALSSLILLIMVF